jgi:predicted phosphodiesterase
MQITFISDTHTKHHELTSDLSGGPILVHWGDVSSRGYKWEIMDFLEWFSDLPYTHKIMIPGNHDFFFDYARFSRTPQGKMRFGNSTITKDQVDEVLSLFPDIHFLNDSGVTVEGIRFWGSPITPWFHDWAYNRLGSEIADHWNMIPEGTDVLITHGPPFGILDEVIRGRENVGCPILLNKIKEIKPKIHSFGHIHEADGILQVDETLFINASSLSVRYEYTNKPIIINYEDYISRP